MKNNSEISQAKKYSITKHPDQFYFDYVIQDGKCYIFQEFHSRVKTDFVCDTDKTSCDEIIEDENFIYITL